MNTIAVQTYTNHERAEYAHEVELYKRSLDLYTQMKNEAVHEDREKVTRKDAHIVYAGSRGAYYGGIAGATIAILMSYGQMVATTGGTMDTMLISALFGLFIGAAVGSLDNAFKSYQTTRRSLASAGRYN
ncbi:MAG: hypothetical protein RI947_966 [Candidatus Parcubacteria bacterium]